MTSVNHQTSGTKTDIARVTKQIYHSAEKVLKLAQDLSFLFLFVTVGKELLILYN